MARIHKINGYLIDPNGDYNADNIEIGITARSGEDYKRLKSEKEQDIYERAYRDGQDKGLSDGRFVGYNKAIDDFVEKLKSNEFQKYKLDMVFETSRDLTYSQCVNAFHEYIDEITKQLKKGRVDD